MAVGNVNAKSATSCTFFNRNSSRCSRVPAPLAQIAARCGKINFASVLFGCVRNGPIACAAFTVGVPSRSGTAVINALYTVIGIPRPSTNEMPATSMTQSESRMALHPRERIHPRGIRSARDIAPSKASGNSTQASRNGSRPSTFTSCISRVLVTSSLG